MKIFAVLLALGLLIVGVLDIMAANYVLGLILIGLAGIMGTTARKVLK